MRTRMSRQSFLSYRSKILLVYVVCCDFLFSQCWSYVHKPQILLGDLKLEALSAASRQKHSLLRLKCQQGGTAEAVVEKKRLKVLCLHGYLSSSKYFQLQLRRLVDDAQDISDFVFLDGPHRFGLLKQPVHVEEPLDSDKIEEVKRAPAGKFRWWYASEDRGGNEGYEEAVQYAGLRESLQAIAITEKEKGPFDVVLGHSQGACLVVAMDCLKCRPDFLSTLLNAEDLNSKDSKETTESDEPSDKLALPDSILSIVIGGFVPRDQIFDMLFRSIEQDASMNGLPQKSLHLFSHEDSIVPPEASMQAMYLYDNPRMMIRDGEHDPDDRTVDQVLQALKSLWSKKYSPPLVLLD